MPRRILLVGEAGPDRPGLETVLRREAFDIVGDATDLATAMDLARCLQPDFAILALDIPEDDAVAMIREVVLACPAIRLVGVGGEPTEGRLEAAFRAGLHGYVIRERAAADLIRALREVGRGSLFLSPRASRALVEKYL